MALGAWVCAAGSTAAAASLAIAVLALYRRARRCRAELHAQVEIGAQSEAALRRAEARYQDLYEHVAVGLFEITPDGRRARVNTALVATCGYESQEELIAAIPDAARYFGLPGFDSPVGGCQTVLSWADQTGGPIRYEAAITQKSGDSITAQLTLRPVPSHSAADVRIEGAVEDMTERKRAMDAVNIQRDLGIQLGAESSGPALEQRWGCAAELLPARHGAWELEAHYLALRLVNPVCTFAPQRILMGGGVMRQARLFDLVRDSLAHLMRGYMPVPEVIPPGLEDRAGVLGALALAEQAFKDR